MILASLNRYRDVGLLIMRVGVGIMYMFYGIPKLMGGPGLWTGLATGLGLTVAPVFWGFMAAFAEGVGGLLLVLGFFHRVAAFLLVCTMTGAVIYHLQQEGPAGQFLTGYARPLELLLVCLGLFFTGPGRYSVDEALHTDARRHESM